MIEVDIAELMAAARVNLQPRDLTTFVKLLNGEYTDDGDALRGFIWACLEQYELDS